MDEVNLLLFSSIEYVLQSRYDAHDSTQIIATFKTLVHVLPVDSRTIDLAIASDFNDFEDSILHACALENNLNTLVTRNVKDYRKSGMDVLAPESFLQLPGLP